MVYGFLDFDVTCVVLICTQKMVFFFFIQSHLETLDKLEYARAITTVKNENLKDYPSVHE